MDEKRMTEALRQFRALAYARTPRPSQELSRRLDLQMLEGLPAASSATQLTVTTPSPARPGRFRAVLSWLAGLGVAAKIILGVALTAAAATGAGAAGVLPGPAQQVFDTVLPGLAPHEPTPIADDPTTPPTSTHTAVPEDEDGTTDESTEGDGAGKPSDTPGNGGEGTGKPEGTPGNGGEGTGKPDDTPGNGGEGTGKPDDTPGNGGEGTGKPENTPGGNPNK